MKKQNLLILILSLGAVFAVSSCNNNNNSNSSVEETSSSETTSSSNTSSEETSSEVSSSSQETSSEETSSSEDISSSEVIETNLTVTISFGDAYDGDIETLKVKEGEEIDLSDYALIDDDYDCLSWSDGTTTYDANAKITVTKNMTITGNFVKKVLGYTLSEDETYYIVSRFIDITKEKVEIPATYRNLPVKEIAGDAFSFSQSDVAIKELVVSDSVEKIGGGAFTSLKSLRKLTVPFYGETLDDCDSTFGYLFGVGGSMQGIAVPETLKEITITKQEIIGVKAFDNLKNVEKVTLGNAKEIKSQAFSSMDNLKTVKLNEGLISLGSNSFTGLANLSELNLPESLEVYNNAISSSGVTSLYFGANLKTYTNRNEAGKVKEIIVSPDNKNFASIFGVMYTKDLSTVLTYPSAKDNESFNLMYSVKNIGNNAFMYSKFTSVKLRNVEVIGDEAFRYSKITSVTIPDTVKSIGQTAFSGSKLTSVTFPEKLKNVETLKVGEFMFSSCDNLKELTVPAYIVDIPDYFTANNLEKITFLGSIKSIGDKAFAGTKLTELDLTFKDNATIGDAIFMNCGSLSTVYIHFEEGVSNYPTLTEEGFYTFIPNFVCDNDTVMMALKTKWSKYASAISNGKASPFLIEGTTLTKFNGTKDDVDVVIPEGITKIDYQAFYGNKFIKSVVIPSTVVAFGQRIFDRCSNLKVVEFKGDFPGKDILYYDYQGKEGLFKDFYWGNNRLIILAKDEIAKNDLKKNINSNVSDSVFVKDEVVISDDMVISNDGETLIRAYDATDSFVVPSTVKYLDRYCFYQANITSFDFTGIVSIGAYAFNESTITEVVLPESVTYVGANAFFECEELVSIKIEGAAYLDDYAFDTCVNLESIDLGSKTIYLGQGAFNRAGENNGIEYVILPASLEYMTGETFGDAIVGTFYCCFSEDYASENFEDFDYIYDFCDEVVFDYEG